MMNVVQSPSAPLGGAPLWPLSVAAYHALGELGLIPEKTELLYGFVYTKMPKSPLHCPLVWRLRQLLEQTVPPGCFVDGEQPISCTDSEPEPDLAIFRGVREDYWNNHPNTAELVAEICITSHEYDRSKLRAYAAADVKECWLVLGPEKQIEVFRQPINGQFTEHTVLGPGGTLTSATFPQCTLSLDAFFAK
jgi:Uma2 family endonuclease